MNPLLAGMPSPERALLLCGTVLLLTAVVHIFVTVSPRRAHGRAIFRHPRPVVQRLVSGDASPAVSLLCGLLAILLSTVTGGALRFTGLDHALLAGPVPGLLFTVWVVVASLRRPGGSWLVRVALSALTSLCMLSAGLLLLLITEGARWPVRL